MMTRAALCILAVASVRGDNKKLSISDIWKDDYKIFDKMYGKTSDRNLYGATLPPAIRFDVPKNIQISPSGKNERYTTRERNVLDLDTIDHTDRYAKILPKSHLAKPTLQFISLGDSRPISKSTDPEAYNYLKNLEKKMKKKEVPKTKISDSEEDEAYRSIQEILDAHEANKGEVKEERTKTNKGNEKYARNNKRSKVRFVNNNSLRSRCVSGRCRPPVRSRPYLKIKRYRYSRR